MCYSRMLIDKLEIRALTLTLNLQTPWHSLQAQMRYNAYVSGSPALLGKRKQRSKFRVYQKKQGMDFLKTIT